MARAAHLASKSSLCPSCSTRPRTHSLPAHRGGVGSGVGYAVSTTVMRNAREVRTSAWIPAARESRPRFVAMFSGCIDEASSSYGPRRGGAAPMSGVAAVVWRCARRPACQISDARCGIYPKCTRVWLSLRAAHVVVVAVVMIRHGGIERCGGRRRLVVVTCATRWWEKLVGAAQRTVGGSATLHC